MAFLQGKIEKMDQLVYDSICWSRDFIFAVLAQLVEHLHGKEKVPGSIPGNGSKNYQHVTTCNFADRSTFSV